MNTTLLWMLLIPVLCAAVLYFLNRDNLPLWGGPALAVPGLLIIALVFGLSYGSAVGDTEIYSGQVLSKARVQGTYEESYECMCSTDSKGNRSCSTCYRTHYTVNWGCATSVGPFTIDSVDSTWSSVYSTPDPGRYTLIRAGDPVSRKHRYTNYVQAVPNSLYSVLGDSTKAKFTGKLPLYPQNVYDFYRIDRFVQYGFSLSDAAQWNQGISMMLRDLGPKKQVNVIVVLAKTHDPMYADALRDAWRGVKKNDVVLVLGSEDGHKIEFARVISWTKNALFKVELRDAVQDLGVVDRDQVLALVQAQISKNFERRHMAEFAYLKGEIDPPEWLLFSLLVVLLAGYAGGAWYLKR